MLSFSSYSLNQPHTKFSPSEDQLGGSEWQPVELAPSGDTVSVPECRDAREVFLEAIFQPGLFSTQDIVKALSVTTFLKFY